MAEPEFEPVAAAEPEARAGRRRQRSRDARLVVMARKPRPVARPRRAGPRATAAGCPIRGPDGRAGCRRADAIPCATARPDRQPVSPPLAQSLDRTASGRACPPSRVTATGNVVIGAGAVWAAAPRDLRADRPSRTGQLRPAPVGTSALLPPLQSSTESQCRAAAPGQHRCPGGGLGAQDAVARPFRANSSDLSGADAQRARWGRSEGHQRGTPSAREPAIHHGQTRRAPAARHAAGPVSRRGCRGQRHGRDDRRHEDPDELRPAA